MCQLTNDSEPQQTSEAETSAALESSNDRPSPGMVESSAPPNTGQTSQENIDEEVRNRQAAVEYVVGPEAEKLENFSSSPDRLVVPVDTEISQLLTDEDLEKEKIPETGDDSCDESGQAVVEDGVRADTEVQENSSCSDTLPVPVDSEISQLLTNEDLEKEKDPGTAHHSDDESDQIKHKDALLLSMEEGQMYSAGLGDEESVVPLPTELELQRNLHTAAAPGAFSVVPQEEHRARDVLFRRNENSGGDVERIASARPQGGVVEPQAANGETLVSATLVPSVPAEGAPAVLPSNTTSDVERGESSNEACVAHVEGMSCWTFVKRNRKAQAGVVCATLFFLFLVAALVYAVVGNPADDDDKLLTLAPLTLPPEEDTGG
jgi:hypothetical protein